MASRTLATAIWPMDTNVTSGSSTEHRRHLFLKTIFLLKTKIKDTGWELQEAAQLVN